MNRLVLVASLAAGVYLLAGTALWATQRRLIFPAPDVPRAALDEAARVFGCEPVSFTASDGVALYGWYRRAQGEKAVLFLHGNAETVADRPELIAQIVTLGWDVFMPAYRGYPGSDGHPSEAGLALDARAAWQYLVDDRGIPPENIVIHGKSLGGGVASGLASVHPPAALVLESTFTSLPDVAASFVWMYPVSVLMPDRFDTASRAPELTMPVLLLHGVNDRLIDVSHARRNAELFPNATLVEVTAGHAETLTQLDDAARPAYMRLLKGAVP